MKDTYSELPFRLRFGLWLYVGFAFFAAWDMSFWWLVNEDYSFGFIVPFFCGYVIFERWPKFRNILFSRDEDPDAPSADSTLNKLGPLVSVLAWVALLAGLALYMLAAMIRAAQGPVTIISWGFGAGICALLLCGAYLLSDRDAHDRPIPAGRRLYLCAWLIFPALVWFVAAPLPGPVDAFIRLNLLQVVTNVVFGIFNFIGLPLEQQGNVLLLPKGKVGVEDACSGIRSLTACLFAGSFLSAVFLDKLWKKICLVATSMVFAFLNNIVRGIFLTSWAYAYGPDATNKIHDAAGYAVLGLTCIMLMALIPVFNFKPKPFDPEDAHEDQAENNLPPEIS